MKELLNICILSFAEYSRLKRSEKTHFGLENQTKYVDSKTRLVFIKIT